MTIEERAVLDRLLSADFPGVIEFRAQAEAILGVKSSCVCGCPSVAPTIDREIAPAAKSSTLALAEIQELTRSDGVPRSVLLFIDTDGYITDLECVYYDDALAEWPVLANSVVMVHDDERYLTSVVLPGGSAVRPQEPNDHWEGTDFNDSGFTATTWSGYSEVFDLTGVLTSRTFVK
jgi:hypothetical protein